MARLKPFRFPILGRRLSAFLLGSFVVVFSLAADVLSEFGEGDEGWRVIELADTFGAGPYVNIVRGPYRPAYTPEGGHPGGALVQVDTPGNSFFFSAPASFRGDQSAAYGGFLRYDLATAQPPPGQWYVEADVILTGTNGTVLAAQTVNSGPAGWTTYGLPLLESAWRKNSLTGSTPTRVEFLAVLGAIRSLWIRGEQYYGTDTTYLDNVRLELPPPLRLELKLTDTARLSAPVVARLGYVLETTSDLSRWQPVAEFVATGPDYTASLPRDDDAPRFYRLRLR